MKALHQFVAGYSSGDAITNEARVFQRLFRSWGYASEIYADPARILPELREEARDVGCYAASPGAADLVLLHLSVGSDINDLFSALPGRKALLYHNITPPEYYRPYKRSIADELARGREQAAGMAGKVDIAMADSRYNARELESWGYRDVHVLPLVLDLATIGGEGDPGVARKLDDGAVNVLFVGRCVPNKRIDDALRAFTRFKASVHPSARFIHVGSVAGTQLYHALLLTLIRDHGIDGDVVFAGTVPQAELNAYYQAADLFLCMSEHEGFCIPLLESMVHDVPILAYDAAAVPETLDGAGVLFAEKDFNAIAEMMGRMVQDQDLRAAVLEGQRDRLQRYRDRDLGAELKQHLELP